MDNTNIVDWAYYKRQYRKKHNIKSRKTSITKLSLIKESRKLTNIFNQAVENLLNKEVD